MLDAEWSERSAHSGLAQLFQTIQGEWTGLLNIPCTFATRLVAEQADSASLVNA